jgi:hypothetical protein
MIVPTDGTAAVGGHLRLLVSSLREPVKMAVKDRYQVCVFERLQELFRIEWPHADASPKREVCEDNCGIGWLELLAEFPGPTESGWLNGGILPLGSFRGVQANEPPPGMLKRVVTAVWKQLVIHGGPRFLTQIMVSWNGEKWHAK